MTSKDVGSCSGRVHILIEQSSQGGPYRDDQVANVPRRTGLQTMVQTERVGLS